MLAKLTWLFLLLVALVTAAKLWVFHIVKVENQEMAPTFVEGDHLLINRRFLSIERGDTLLLRHPQGDHWLLRRVVGISGDRVEVRGGVVRLNGSDLTREPAGEILLRGSASTSSRAHLLEAERLGARVFRTVRQKGSAVRAGPSTVVTDGYYVLGDNRTSAIDSRALGVFATRYVEGKVVALLEPSSDAGPAFEGRGWSLAR